MSNYNSQLQSNNTDLQTVLQTLQTKAAGGIVVDDVSKAIIDGTVTSINDDSIESIRSYALYSHSGLTAVSFPAATNIGGNAFYNCSKLTTISFPNVTSIGNSAFYGCSNITTASFPVATTISGNAFEYCASLATASFPAATNISNYAFRYCYNLKSLYLTGSSLCTLSNSNAFLSTPIGGYSTTAGTYGSIYVPASLLTSYQTATNWTYFSSRFVAYTGDGGGTNLITFSIDGTEYQAEEGMTWGAWIDSEYNTNGFYANNNNVYGKSAGGSPGLVGRNNGYVLLNDTIISEAVYTIASSGGAD